MPVKRRAGKTRTALPPEVEMYFFDEELDPTGFAKFVLDYDNDTETWGKGSDLWARYGEQVVAEWIQLNPGMRPSCWWRWSAPEGLRCGKPDFPFQPPPAAEQRALLAAYGCLMPDEVA